MWERGAGGGTYLPLTNLFFCARLFVSILKTAASEFPSYTSFPFCYHTFILEGGVALHTGSESIVGSCLRIMLRGINPVKK